MNLRMTLAARPWAVFRFLVLALAAAIFLPGSARANHALYKKVVLSTVGFYERKVDLKKHSVYDGFYGSGVLVDVERRLVVTADHVVRRHTREGIRNVLVMFPQTDDKGHILTEALYYKRRRSRLAIPGTVIYQNRLKDLALVQLERLPEGAKALPLAAVDPKVADPIHVIGNSTYFMQLTKVSQLGAAFGYSKGYIRNIHYLDDRTRDEPVIGQVPGPITSILLTLLHHAPSDRGDSGGAIVNNDGELVGIVSGGLENRVLANPDIHIAEVRRTLENIQLPAADVISMKLSTDSDADADTPGMDNFYLPVHKGETIKVQMHGDGKTFLDLYAKDIDTYPERRDFLGNPIQDDKLLRLLERTRSKGTEKGQFAPTWDGICLVQVLNHGDRAKKNFRNDYTLKIHRKNKVPGVFTAIRQLSPGGTDFYEIPYQAGKGKARVSIRGDHDMKFDLTVLDPNNKKVARCPCPTDVEELTWTPAVTGVYTIRVESKGPMGDRKIPVWSQYILTTD
jgi:hypothetical protein